MKRIPVKLRPAAVEDLIQIADFISDKSGMPGIALGFVRRIRQRCQSVGDAPNGGAPRPDLGEGIRLVPFEKSAVILYRVVDGTVEITNVFYGGRDYAALLSGIDPDPEP